MQKLVGKDTNISQWPHINHSTSPEPVFYALRQQQCTNASSRLYPKRAFLYSRRPHYPNVNQFPSML
jgi:hypothetical protein